MKKTELIIATVIVVAFGTSMHFVHELPFFHNWMNYIFPANESVWEHMKMVVYPLLLCGLYLCTKQKTMAPIGGFMITALASIPAQIALFFVYWPFTHHSVLIFDIILYTGVMVAATIFGNKLSQKDSIRKAWPIWTVVAVMTLAALAVLTTFHPDIYIFTNEV